ncbi:MAG TPA: hypothetical protein VL983_05895 [Terriglobales bacterium]|nr:hypothetical protein [Terriglobales bacterium]
MNWVLAIVVALGFSAAGVAATFENGTASGAASEAQATTKQPSSSTNNPSAASNGTQRSKPQATGSSGNAGGTPARKKQLLPSLPVAPPGESPPHKVVIKQGGVREPSAQIVTDMAPAEVTKKREESERLLDEADENLKRLADRTLSEQQQETVSQIDHYMTVARSALKEGDVSRGHTLALKANLLAQDLAKR